MARACAMPLALLTVLGACFHGKRSVPAAAAAAAPAQSLLPMARLYYDNGGGLRDSVRQVVHDPQVLTGLWQQATAGQASPPPLPSVDFSREMVLVVGAGRMTPDDQIQVDSVAVQRRPGGDGRQQETATAWISVIQGCGHFQADAYPLEIVRVRRFDGPVRFVAQRVQPAACK